MRDIMRIIFAVALVLGCVSGITGVVSAADGGSISGFVYQDDNVTPIEGAVVYAKYYPAGGNAGSASTAADGSYTISNLSPGEYRVLAEAETYQRELYDNLSETEWSSADPVTVPATGDQPTGINFTLTPGGSISGSVQQEDGNPIQGAHVVAYDNATGIRVDCDFTGDDGAYSIATGLYSGSYLIKAEAPGFVTRYYDNVTDWALATPVSVTPPNDTPLPPFVLMPGGSISGTVYESDNVTPVAGALVQAYDIAVGKVELRDHLYEQTAADGTYVLNVNIYPADWVVFAQADGYVTQYWQYVTDNTEATLITVTGEENHPSINFSLQNIAPRVTTGAATDINTTSATLNGNLTSKGTAENVTVTFVWGTAAGGPYTQETTPSEVMTDTGAFSFDLGSLTPGTTYYYVAKAVGDDTGYGGENSFTTLSTPPSVSTNDATAVTTTTARLNGMLASLGTAGTVNVSFVWGTTAGGPYAQETTPLQPMTDGGTFYFDLGSLIPGTTYYYKAKADGDGDPVYGDEKSFNALTAAPSVTTNDATNVTATSATVNSTLGDLGTADNVTVSFEWGTAAGSYTQTTTNQVMTGTGAFSGDLSGLTSGTTYYYRAKAVGDGTVYGAEKTFTALAAPAVTTDSPTDVQAASARLNGNLTSLGTSGSVTVSFVWGTAAGGPYPNETTGQARTATGAFYFDLGNLGPVTTYYYQVKAVGDGTVYGAERSFKTIDAAAPVISVVSSSDITVSETTIAWSTDEAATSQVEYGLTEEYGSITPLDTNLATGHSVDLTGLKAGKTYHYRVISKDASNNQAESGDNTFTTTARSGGMPVWAWVIIALALVAVLGAAAYLIRSRLAQS